MSVCFRSLIMSCSPDACGLTLDPNTAHRELSLSEDNRKVTWVSEQQSYPDHPERFDSWHQVLSRESLTGRCYWEVEWEGKVVIGVAYRGITRRGKDDDTRLGGNNKSWSLMCLDAAVAAAAAAAADDDDDDDDAADDDDDDDDDAADDDDDDDGGGQLLCLVQQ